MKNIVMVSFLTLSFATYAQVPDKTIQGILSVKDNTLFLNGKEINPKIEGDFSLSMEKNINYKNGNAILLANNSGGTACPLSFRWVLILPDSIKQSPDFGNCSEFPKVTVDGDKLMILFPKFKSAPKEVVIFDGNKITKNGVPWK